MRLSSEQLTTKWLEEGFYFRFHTHVWQSPGSFPLLIGEEGAKTPAGVRGWGDPAGALAPRRLPATPAESEVHGAEINSYL